MIKSDILTFVKQSSDFDIETLEKRLKPKYVGKSHDENYTLHAGYLNYSSEGFLGHDESLKDVLREHDALVQQSGSNYDFLANKLQALLDLSNKKSEKSWNENRLISFLKEVILRRKYSPYNPSTTKEIPFLRKGIYYYDLGMVSFGGQCCPFADDKNKICQKIHTSRFNGFITDRKIDARTANKIIACPISSPEIRAKVFKEVYTVEDLPPFAMVSSMHIHLIRYHHFFEGNKTSYRCDPRILTKAFV